MGEHQQRPRLSAAVLVYNGVRTIERCVRSLVFCDEILVVDDFSTDGTWELLQDLPVRAVRHPHETFAKQRAFARDLSKGVWLLSMDADEVVSEELAEGILAAVEAGVCDCYYLRRKNPYPIGLRGYHWSKHPRLVIAAKCKWIDTDSPHAPLDLTGLRCRKIGHGYLEHEPLDSIASSLRKSINRSLIMAEQLRSRGRTGSLFRLILSTTARFLKLYFGQGACLHGRAGFVFSCLGAFDAFTKYAFLLSSVRIDAGRLQDGTAGSYSEKSEIIGTSREEGSEEHRL